jgi:hypothetical protein
MRAAREVAARSRGAYGRGRDARYHEHLGAAPVIDGISMSTIFAVSFLGALFAILAALLLVYTYVMLRVIPKLRRSFRAFVEEIGPKATLERANIDPVEIMAQLGIQQPRSPPPTPGDDRAAGKEHGVLVFTCEDHGRCPGCPNVLAQFEAIIRHQGEDSFDALERECYTRLREKLSMEGALNGESADDRQQGDAA